MYKVQKLCKYRKVNINCRYFEVFSHASIVLHSIQNEVNGWIQSYKMKLWILMGSEICGQENAILEYGMCAIFVYVRASICWSFIKVLQYYNQTQFRLKCIN